MKAMVFAAGLGTRMKPITDTLPKALVKYKGVPMIEHILLKLKKSGVEKVIINVHHFAQKIIDFIEEKQKFGLEIAFSDESEQLLETGGGLKKASWFFTGDEPFILHNVDVHTSLNIKDLYNSHLQQNNIATLACSTRPTSRSLLFDNDLRLWAWRNNQTNEYKGTKPNGNFNNLRPLAYSTVSVVSPEFLNLMTETGKFSIVDVWLILAPYYRIGAFLHDGDDWIDMSKEYEKNSE